MSDAGSSPAPKHAAYMAEALELAARGACTTHPNPRVGCVIVQGGEIVGRGFHERAGGPHAEIHALRSAGDRAQGADVYVTLEPCAHFGRTPPCAEALVEAGVRRVFASMVDPNPQVAGQGLARLRAAGIEAPVPVEDPRAHELNRGFISRMSRQRPWVTLKLAASIDGRTAMANGESQWITGTAARADVHRLRAEAGCVLTSAATVRADNPRLDVRDWHPAQGSDARTPDRVVLDTAASTRADAKVWADSARRFWLVSQVAEGHPAGVEQILLPRGTDGHLDFRSALAALAEREVNEVLVESGPRLAGALLVAGAVDRVVLYLAPHLLGHEARPLAHLPGLEHLQDRIALTVQDLRMIGEDIRITATPKRRN